MKKTSPTRSTRTARAVPVKTKAKASAKVKIAKPKRQKRPGLVAIFTPAQKRRMKDGTATFRDRIALKQHVA